jgi:hypothetical protein
MNTEVGRGAPHNVLRPPDLPQSGDAIIYTAEWMRNVTWKDIASASGERQRSGMRATEL